MPLLFELMTISSEYMPCHSRYGKSPGWIDTRIDLAASGVLSIRPAFSRLSTI